MQKKTKKKLSFQRTKMRYPPLKSKAKTICNTDLTLLMTHMEYFKTSGTLTQINFVKTWGKTQEKRLFSEIIQRGRNEQGEKSSLMGFSDDKLKIPGTWLLISLIHQPCSEHSGLLFCY